MCLLVFFAVFIYTCLCNYFCVCACYLCVRAWVRVGGGGWKCCSCIFMQSNYVDLIGFVYVESVSPPVMYYCWHGWTLHTHTLYSHTSQNSRHSTEWLNNVNWGFIFVDFSGQCSNKTVSSEYSNSMSQQLLEEYSYFYWGESNHVLLLLNMCVFLISEVVAFEPHFIWICSTVICYTVANKNKQYNPKS